MTEQKTIEYLIEACKVVRGILISRQDVMLTECSCQGTGFVPVDGGTTIDCDECLAYAIGRLDDAINGRMLTADPCESCRKCGETICGNDTESHRCYESKR